jgi:hypothetical protein
MTSQALNVFPVASNRLDLDRRIEQDPLKPATIAA